MNKLKIFVAAPISSFSDKDQYKCHRNGIIEMIKALRKDNTVFSEVERLSNLDSYDDPGASVLEDFDKISKSDIFILVHPVKMQTSTLIELGYALAHEKNIIIVSNEFCLPFLAQGLCSVNENVILIKSAEINDDTINKVSSSILSLNR